MNDILGGVRSTCTYVGAAEIRELPKRTSFIRVTMQLNETFGAFQQPTAAPVVAASSESNAKRAKTD